MLGQRAGGDKSQPPAGLTMGDAAWARWCLAMGPLVGSAGFEGSQNHSRDFLQNPQVLGIQFYRDLLSVEAGQGGIVVEVQS